MATNLAISDDLIEQARVIGQHSTKKAAVTAALEEYVQRRNQWELLKLFGTIEYDADYDYKALRERLRVFPDEPVETRDHERAAEFANLCRSQWVQGSPTDSPICALAHRHGLAIFTTDGDFVRYKRYLPITMHEV